MAFFNRAAIAALIAFSCVLAGFGVQGRLWAAWARRVTKRESFRTVRKGDAIDVNALRANKARLPGGERGNQGVGGP